MPKGGDTQLLQVVRRQALQETSSISFFAKLAHTAQGRRLGPCPGNFVQVPPSLIQAWTMSKHFRPWNIA